jgi:hypothetical protein
MKICTCSKCIINTIRNKDGQIISGKYLSTQNVAKHRSEDQQRSLELKNNTFNQLNDCSDSPPVELPEPSEYSEEIGAFSGLDENEDSLHLCEFSPNPRGLIAARPKGVRTPPQTPKKQGVRGLHAFLVGVPTPAHPPLHAARLQ